MQRHLGAGLERGVPAKVDGQVGNSGEEEVWIRGSRVHSPGQVGFEVPGKWLQGDVKAGSWGVWQLVGQPGQRRLGEAESDCENTLHVQVLQHPKHFVRRLIHPSFLLPQRFSPFCPFLGV